MAVFARLFKGAKNNRNIDCKLINIDQKDGWQPRMFEASQIRMVIFQDHDIKGRKLIFDSKAIKRVEEIKEDSPKKCKLQKTEDKSGIDNLPKYQFLRPSSDTKLLGEMVFGSVAMTYQGSTLKVHSLRAPPQLMVTKVFIPSRSNRESSNYGEDSYDTASLQLSLNDLSTPQNINGNSICNSIAQSVPMDVPLSSRRYSREDDSGLSMSASSQASDSFRTPFPSPSSSSSINSNSFNSLHRRWLRSQTTSLESGIHKRKSGDADGQPTPPSQRRSKIGFAILLPIETEDDDRAHNFHDFFFSHMTLVEGHVNKLKLALEHGCSQRGKFLQIVMEALEVFQKEVYDLYVTPRFPQPVWLNMMAYSTHRYALCNQFMKELMQSVEKYDTKNTNFFISTLLTAVLTYHLAWVPTVTPSGVKQSRVYLDKHTAKWLDTLARSHPYNPLWAQLGDLYGAIGFPARLARTVVVGKKAELVRKILYLLSYFIRCSEIHENVEERTDTEDLMYEANLCPMCGGNCQGGDTPVMEKENIFLISREEGKGPINVCDNSTFSDKVVEDLSDNVNCRVCQCSTSFTQTQTIPSLYNVRQADLEASTSTTDSSNSTVTRLSIRNVVFDNEMSVELENSHSDASFSDSYSRPSTTSCISKYFENSDCISSIFDSVASSNGRFSDSGFESDELLTMNEENESSTDYKKKVGNSCFYKPLNRDTMCISERQAVKDNVVQQICDNGRETHQSVNTITPVIKPNLTNILLPEDVVECKLSPEAVREPKVERIRNVGRSAITEPNESINACVTNTKISNGLDIDYETPFPGKFSDSDELAIKQRLPNSYNPTKVTSQVINGRTFFRWPSREGSNSMFDEYFDQNVEVKTIDDVTPVNVEATFSPDIMQAGTLSINCSSDLSCEQRHVDLNRSVSGGTITPTSCVDEFFENVQPEKRKIDLLLKVPREPARLQEPVRCLSPSCEEYGTRFPPGSYIRSISSITERSELSPVNEEFSRSGYCRQESIASDRTCRCRSVTPTELIRRRHVSSCSAHSIDGDHDPFLNLKDLPLPRSKQVEETSGSRCESLEQSFGRSLLAGYSDHYLSDFVLHGTSEKNVESKFATDLSLAVQSPVLDEPVMESVGIVADTDDWNVQILSSLRTSSEKNGKSVTASKLVVSMIESVKDLWELKMSPEFCLMHLEDRLQEMYFKSRMLAEYVNSQKKLDLDELSSMLGFDASDLQLLLSIAGTHSPHLAFGIY